jgi:hypothetical protein
MTMPGVATSTPTSMALAILLITRIVALLVGTGGMPVPEEDAAARL